jgi:citrate synthase
MKTLMQAFRYDAHPMGMFISTVAALSTFYPEANQVNDAENRLAQIKRLIAKVPTIAAFSYRHNRGLPYVYPNNDFSYTGNFLSMMFKMGEAKYAPNPALERALDILFILHADHEQNCSTNAMRAIGSSRVDPYSAMAGAAAALYGPLHGGANEEVLKMLSHIREKQNIPEFIQRVKNGEGRLMGFGHRIYKNYDPRARIIKRAAEAVFEVTGRNRLLDIALELERIALEDEYFAQTLPERGFLFGHHLSGDGFAGRDVSGAVRDSAHGGLARAVAGDDHRPGAKDRAPAPSLCRTSAPRVGEVTA